MCNDAWYVIGSDMELAGVHLMSAEDETPGISKAVLQSLTVRGMHFLHG